MLFRGRTWDSSVATFQPLADSQGRGCKAATGWSLGAAMQGALGKAARCARRSIGPSCRWLESSDTRRALAEPAPDWAQSTSGLPRAAARLASDKSAEARPRWSVPTPLSRWAAARRLGLAARHKPGPGPRIQAAAELRRHDRDKDNSMGRGGNTDEDIQGRRFRCQSALGPGPKRKERSSLPKHPQSTAPSAWQKPPCGPRVPASGSMNPFRDG
jgi:hypothetical protein